MEVYDSEHGKIKVERIDDPPQEERDPKAYIGSLYPKRQKNIPKAIKKIRSKVNEK